MFELDFFTGTAAIRFFTNVCIVFRTVFHLKEYPLRHEVLHFNEAGKFVHFH